MNGECDGGAGDDRRGMIEPLGELIRQQKRQFVTTKYLSQRTGGQGSSRYDEMLESGNRMMRLWK